MMMALLVCLDFGRGSPTLAHAVPVPILALVLSSAFILTPIARVPGMNLYFYFWGGLIVSVIPDFVCLFMSSRLAVF